MSLSTRRGLGAALLLALATLGTQTVEAQTASYKIVGTNCTGGRLNKNLPGVPFQVTGVPRLGGSIKITTEGSGDYPWGVRRQNFLLTGASGTNAGGLKLPFDISVLATTHTNACGMLRTSGEVWTMLPFTRDYRALVDVVLPIPNSTALKGLTFYQQVMSVDRSSFGPPFRGYSLSAGGVGTIGL